MTKSLTILSTIAVVSTVTGCRINGEWERLTTDPPHAMFPVDHLTLDDDHHYTARWAHGARKFASTGTYRYHNGKLSIAESGRVPRDYGAHLRLDGKLELSYTVNGKTIKAVLERHPTPKKIHETEPKLKEDAAKP